MSNDATIKHVCEQLEQAIDAHPDALEITCDDLGTVVEVAIYASLDGDPVGEFRIYRTGE